MEIERKWKLRSLPARCGYNTFISQGYLVRGDTEVRIREEGTKHTLTVKQGSGLSRHEIETPIFQSLFNSMWRHTEGARLIKRRYVIKLQPDIMDNHTVYSIEIDRYYGDLSNLVIMEVEFRTIEEANNFIIPDWVDVEQEVTGLDEYKNQNLAG